MGLIVISREMGSGGNVLGRAVAEHLGWRFGDRELLLGAVSRYRLPEAVVARLEETKPSFWERFRRDRERYPVFIRAVTLAFAADDDAVVAGRMAPYFFDEVPHALRVRVTAPAAIRAARVAEESKISLREAEQRIESYDEDTAARLEHFFGDEARSRMHYDVELNTARGSLEGHTAALAEFVRHPPFRSTPEARQVLRDAAIAAQVKAELAQIPELDAPAIEVRSRGGDVSIGGTVFGAEWEARAIAAARAVPGVGSVTCESLDAAAGYVLPPR